MVRMQTFFPLCILSFTKLSVTILGMMIWHHITLARCMEAKILLLITERLYRESECVSQKQSDKLKF